MKDRHPRPLQIIIFRCMSLHIKEKTCTTLLIMSLYSRRNCNKLVLNFCQLKTASLFQSCVLLVPCRLYHFSVHDDYPPFLYTNAIYLHDSATVGSATEGGIANLIYWSWTTNLFLQIPVQLLLTNYQIPWSIWRW